MAATLQGGKQAFSITANQCTGNSLAFGESCKIEVNFAPSVEGLSYLDRLTITSGGMDPRYVSLTGKGGAPVAREVSIIPSAYDFGSIITGQHSGYKRFDILNNGSTEEKVSAIGLAGNSDDFEVRDLPDISTPLKPGERISVEVAFTPHSEGAKTAELVVVVVDQTNPVRAELSGQAGGSEQSILRGLILDRYSQEPIGGASVDLAGMQVSSDAGGNYEITGIDAGRYDIRVRKDGYLDWVQPVTLPASTAKSRNFRLTHPSQAGEIRILGASSKYRGHVTYLKDFDHEVDYTVTIDWGGHAPGEVVISSTSKEIKRQSVDSKRTTVTLNPGKQLEVCDKLDVTAVSKSGHSSDPFEISLHVARIPKWIGASMTKVEKGDHFYYKRDTLVERFLFHEIAVPDRIPIVGGDTDRQ